MNIRYPLTKISVSLLLAFFLGFTLVGFVRAEQSVEVNARIGAKLIFNTAPSKLKLSVDPVDTPTDQATHKLIVKTNAPSYSITASYGEFKIGDYGLFENGNLTVASEAPDSGEGTGGDFVEIKDQVEILAGESGFTNNESMAATYKLNVDFTVPYGSGSTEVVYTATMST